MKPPKTSLAIPTASSWAQAATRNNAGSFQATTTIATLSQLYTACESSSILNESHSSSLSDIRVRVKNQSHRTALTIRRWGVWHQRPRIEVVALLPTQNHFQSCNCHQSIYWSIVNQSNKQRFGPLFAGEFNSRANSISFSAKILTSLHVTTSIYLYAYVSICLYIYIYRYKQI